MGLKLYHEEGLRGFVFEKRIWRYGAFPLQRVGAAEEDSTMRKRNYTKAERSRKTVSRKRMLFAAGILLALYLLTSYLLGEMGLVKYYRMKAQYNTLTEEIATLRQDNARLMRDVRALKTDPDLIERIARDELGLARQGEIVYYYDKPEVRNSEPRSPGHQ